MLWKFVSISTISNDHGPSSLRLKTAFAVLQCRNNQASVDVAQVRLMGVYLEQPGTSSTIAEVLQDRDLLQDLTIDSVARQLVQIPLRITEGLTLNAAGEEILITFGLLKALTRNAGAWASIRRFRAVSLLFKALSHLLASNDVGDGTVVLATSRLAHETLQWLKARSPAISKMLAQAVEGGVLSIISTTFGSSAGLPGTVGYDFAFNDLALVALHTCYPALLKPLKHALSPPSISRDNSGERVRGLWKIVEASLARSLEHYERGTAATTCDNLTHKEATRHSNDSGTQAIAHKTCSNCHTVVYCSKLCQEADWSLHRDECETAKNVYMERKAFGGWLSLRTRMFLRAALERMVNTEQWGSSLTLSLPFLLETVNSAARISDPYQARSPLTLFHDITPAVMEG
ncbi:hypothetical protein D9611_009721 [Ephemerocybe angulata]|uniref:MYND-type domain-containing protein n=1 Tax=Ephemerocybe angulata TaxID=980116 RepID=A0A8H5C6Y8_9AGAR|nr:hypothetical protein D9611_009721 [Tulosesus angulatus]